jgi:hypothetical protein
MTPMAAGVHHQLGRLSTPRAAALAGVLFAVLFGAALILIRTALPEGSAAGSQWLDAGSTRIKIASLLMPFAGIAFLWFIGVVRDGLGRYEDKFFSTVFIGSGILFLAMMFTTFAVGGGLVAISAQMTDPGAQSEVATFGRLVLLTLSKTYGLRMGAVFMISLATMWLRTGVMPRWLIFSTYLVAAIVIIASDVSMWLVLAFPFWVLVVSLLILERAGVIELHLEHDANDAPGSK